MTTSLIVPSVFDLDLPGVDYGDFRDPELVRRAVREARRQAPVAIGPYGPELLSYELVRAFTRDTRFATPKGITLAVQGITSGPLWDRVTQLLISVDGTQHQRLRKLVAKAFTPRAAERMRTACVDVIEDLVDDVAPDGHCDVVTDIADRYPVAIICALLGAPRRDWHLFTRWAADVNTVFGADVAENQDRILGAWSELDAYLEDLIAARRVDPGDDLLTELIAAEDDGDRLSHDELRNLALILLNAGTDTTRNQLAAAVQVLADHPDQWRLLADRPDLARAAVEEVIRCHPIVHNVLRIAVVDVEFAGMRFPAGTFVLGNTAAANRDPAVFPDPDRFDITRADAAAPLTFGGGVHYCLGAHLARVELAEALSVLARRMPNLRRTGPAPWKPITETSGPTTLPVAFGPGH
jgi:cytochrome P450